MRSLINGFFFLCYNLNGDKMNFEDEIINYENSEIKEEYKTKHGKIPVILTAVHTMRQKKEGKVKKSEPFTKAIVEYVSNKVDCSYYIKLVDNGVDSNSKYVDEFKLELLNQIKENKIKLLIDIHGAKLERDFDVEIGTLNNLTVDYSVLKELKEALNYNELNNIKVNELFKGGGIAKFIYSNSDIDIVQLEINKKYRDFKNTQNIKKVCVSLIYFINQYYNIINKMNLLKKITLL